MTEDLRESSGAGKARMGIALPDPRRSSHQSAAVLEAEDLTAYGPARSTNQGAPLSREELRKIDAYWRGQPLFVPGDAIPQGQPTAAFGLLLKRSWCDMNTWSK
jgi:hypothetical protein